MLTCMWCGKKETEKLLLREIVRLKKLKTTTLCRTCKQKLNHLAGSTVCPGCCREWEEIGNFCSDCLKWQLMYPNYTFKNTALYQYNSFLKEWIEAFKYKGDYRLAKVFAPEVNAYFYSYPQKGKLYIPIPVSKKSMELRGFNQVEAVLQAGGVTYAPLLKHIGRGEKQSNKDRKGRMMSKQPFELAPRDAERIRNKKIILIDDVYTTGRTLFHAAELMLDAQAESVETFTIAR